MKYTLTDGALRRIAKTVTYPSIAGPRTRELSEQEEIEAGFAEKLVEEYGEPDSDFIKFPDGDEVWPYFDKKMLLFVNWRTLEAEPRYYTDPIDLDIYEAYRNQCEMSNEIWLNETTPW